jgi:tRNA-2-methylthio-N6-dimethylallyladenosine synthase
MNKADSAELAGALEAAGFERCDAPDRADLVVINSCSVRQSAEEKVQGKLGSLVSVKRAHPETVIALMGCMVGEDQSGLRKRFPMVDHFFPPASAQEVIQAVAAAQPDYALETQCDRVAANWEGSVTAYVPIMQGCNNFCTYCIVPYRRGRERSRPLGEIVNEVRAMVAHGVREVTLLGQNVNSYGQDTPGSPDLADLLAAVNDIDCLCRIRFLTSHPKDMSTKLIEAVAAIPRVCETVNLAVQSGDDRILEAMNRRYTVSHCEEIIAAMRDTIPGVSLTTDLIVGFPGETYEQFRNSYALLERVRFAQVHVAAYSRRPGTVAAELDDDVSPEEKMARLQAVERLQEEIAMAENAKLVGQTVEVLFQDFKKGKWQGRTRSDRLVFVSSDKPLKGELRPVRITKASPWSLQGEVVG